MTHDQHRQRHVELHEALDELIADWLAQSNYAPYQEAVVQFEGSVMSLAKWSKEQTICPTENRYNKEVHLPSIPARKSTAFFRR
jgi:hypothetical protein